MINQSKTTDTMVLRTVFLPMALDNKLKSKAIETNTSQNEMIRKCLEEKLCRDGSTAAKVFNP